MFRGHKDLFIGLVAEQWVVKQLENPSPVLRFDVSTLNSVGTTGIEQAIVEMISRTARKQNVVLHSNSMTGALIDLIEETYAVNGHVVVLIYEYDKPILDNLSDLKKTDEIREVLRSFYTVLKSCDEYLRFVFITGISKFSKMGVFSAMNNLEDISMDKRFGDIAGYTQNELEYYFDDWLNVAAVNMNISRDELLVNLKDYYDGFSCDGLTRLYNPFSILQCLNKGELRNYWYTSGSPTFIVKYMKGYQINDPEEYRYIEVSSDFADTHEIEYSTPESFLYQSGYLTIEKIEGDTLTLDYPNEEVRKSLVRMYLDEIYHVKRYITLGTKLWNALSSGDVAQAIELYNTAIAGVPYDDFPNR